jgi:hypothetical protein
MAIGPVLATIVLVEELSALFPVCVVVSKQRQKAMLVPPATTVVMRNLTTSGLPAPLSGYACV